MEATLATGQRRLIASQGSVLEEYPDTNVSARPGYGATVLDIARPEGSL